MSTGTLRSAGELRILHVDGDPGETRRVATALEADPGVADVVTETDPEEGLSRLVTDDIDCLVSAYDLHGMDGVEFIRMVRETRADVPAILFTDSGSEAVASRAISAGVTDYVRKKPAGGGTDALRERVAELATNGETVSGDITDAASGNDTNTVSRDDAGFARFIQAFPDVVFVVDEEGRYLDVIASGEGSLLYDAPEELIGTRFEEMLPAETADRFLGVLQDALETGKRQRIEYRLDVQAGTRWFEARVGPLETDGERDTAFWIARDITERKRREREYEQIFNEVDAAITVHDPAARSMVDVNETLADWTGYDRDELLANDVGLFSATDQGFTTDRAYDVIEQVAASGEDRTVEWKVETAEGTHRWLGSRATTATIGGQRRVLGISRDITERKRRQQEYEQIFNGVNDSIVVHDPETTEIVDVNETACELLGYDRETLLELGTAGLSVQEEGFTPDRAEEIIEAVMETGEVDPFEWKVETSDGDHRLLEVTATRAEIGGEPRHVSIMRDITERRQRQREYEQIFDSVNDAITVFDPDAGRITEVNDAYREMLGYDLERIRELGIEGLSAAEEGYTGERGWDLIREVAQTGESKTVEWQAETSEGDRVLLEATLTPAEIGGEQRVLSIQRDVTERKRRRREYEQIFNGVNDAIVIQDPETAEPVDANETFLNRLGYDSTAEIRKAGMAGLSASESGYTKQRARELCHRVMETGEPEVVEWQQKTKDGDRRWIEAKIDSAVIRGEDRILSLQRDITERKRREQAIESLQEATERLQRAETKSEVASVAVETASEALDLPMAVCWFHDPEDDRLTPVAATDATREMGLVSELPSDRYEYAVFEEGTVTEYTPAEHSPDNPLEAGVLLPLGEHGLIAAGRRRQTGRLADGSVLDIAGALAEHATTALDRVERARELRESERRFRLIAERIDEVIYLATPDFSEVLYVNPAYESIWGRPAEELYDDARTFLEAVDPRDEEETRRGVQAMLEEMQRGDPADSYEFEYRIRRPGGEIRWVNARGYAVEMAGGERRFVGIVDDITERKHREQRLEVFNRILRHNLRNQLDVIRSHAETLADRADDGDHAARIIAAVDELAAMGARARRTDRIMSTDTGVTEISLPGTLREIVETVTPGDEVEVTTDLPRSARLSTNGEALRAGVRSALENAVAYADSEVRVSLEKETEGYTVVIDDDGPGIPKAELVPIEAGTETNLRHGRGLGLWQLRWGVDTLKGELSFDTDGGTTIRIGVPDRAGD